MRARLDPAAQPKAAPLACTSAPALINSLTISVCACFPPKVHGGTAPDLLCEHIETTSCAVDAEGHLNAMLVVEVVSTFSSFRLESVPD
jgi:hypothetical protein